MVSLPLHSVYVLTVNSFSLFLLLGQKMNAIDTATLTVLLGGLRPERDFFLNAAVS